MAKDDAVYDDAVEEPIAEDVPIGPVAENADDKQWGMFAHLSAIAGLMVGGFTIAGPLIIWLIKKDQSKFVDYHGKEAVNFQLNVLIYYLVSLIITFATCGIAFPLPLLVMVWGIVMPIIAGLAANKGELYRYPFTFRMIK